MKEFFLKVRNFIFNNREVYIWPFIYLGMLYIAAQLVFRITGHAARWDISEVVGYVVSAIPVFLAMLITALSDGHLIFSMNREEWLKATLAERILDAAGPLIIFLSTLLFEYFFLRH